MAEEHLVLGLDMGSASLGWAITKEDGHGRPIGLVAYGVRIFPETVEAKTKAPKNLARRNARAQRRLISRRRRRRDKLLNLLIRANLLPSAGADRDAIFRDASNFDPYRLRAHALDHKLAPYELGRALYHLGHRRGFESNRKGKDRNEDGKVKTAISDLARKMEEAGSRTLGEFLVSQPAKRRRYTSRGMYRDEFERIWQTQATHHSVLTPGLKVAIANAIFHQRPLKVQKHLVGRCSFELKCKRAARAWPLSQRTRMLQDVNHLKIQNPATLEFRALTLDERQKLISKLEKQKTVGWQAARKFLGLNENEVFNLERGKKSALVGCETSCDLAKLIGARWNPMNDALRESLVTDLLTIDNETALLRRLQDHWAFDARTAEQLAQLELEPGYARLSLKAMRQILPHLENGLIYSEACRAAGYDHSTPQAHAVSARLGLPTEIRNPVVTKALYETRKVVNAIIRAYGKPSAVRVEMARDMKLSRRQKEELHKEQRDLEKMNKIAEKALRDDFGIDQPSRADIQKYNLWVESGEQCPYTGDIISKEMLFSPEVDVEHIIPFGRCFDDSYMNKTLCIAAFNRQTKLNRTPWELGQNDPTWYEAMLQRVKRLPWPKRRRFEQKEIKTDEFASRQLNDTRYISRAVHDYLKQLGVDVGVSRGEATAALRYVWGLNRILSPTGGNDKNRADHRHHMIDAVVIALTSPYLLQQMSRITAREGRGEGRLVRRLANLGAPWPQFSDDVRRAVDGVTVSFAPTRKLSDALHEDTAYGATGGEGEYVYRKPLDGNLTSAQIEAIRDATVRNLVKKRFEQFNGNAKQAFGPGNTLFHKDGKTPIRSVRLLVRMNPNTVHAIRNETGVPFKHFKYGNNHHVEIIEHEPTGTRRPIFITTMEAARRARCADLPIVQRIGPWQTNGETLGDGWRFVMSLTANDCVEAAHNDASALYRVQKFSGGDGFEIVLKSLPDSMAERNANSILIKGIAKLSILRGKVSVDPIGRVTPASD
jgi:CRISPR-associated endonuclease Csn1